MLNEDRAVHVKWYERERPAYEILTKRVHQLVEESLKESGIKFYIESRTKSVDSFARKVSESSDPSREREDLSGVRVICYLKSECRKVEGILRKRFVVRLDRSRDKALELGVSEVGYRSIHLVARLTRKDVPRELTGRFEGMFFEVQIRTILQDAWAVIEHSRGYKPQRPPPKGIMRRLGLASCCLEILDNEFERIEEEISHYNAYVSGQKSPIRLELIEIDVDSLNRYLEEKFRTLNIGADFGGSNIQNVIKELNSLGIHNLSDLDEIIPPEFNRKFQEMFTGRDRRKENFNTILMLILIIHFRREYFDTIWPRRTKPSFFPLRRMRFLEAFGVNLGELQEYVTSNSKAPVL